MRSKLQHESNYEQITAQYEILHATNPTYPGLIAYCNPLLILSDASTY